MNETFVHRLSTFVVVVCFFVLTGTAALVVSPPLRQWMGVGPRTEPPPYVAGDRVDIDGAIYQSAPFTVVVFARSTCPSCQRSVPFYAQVVAAATARGIAGVLVTPEVDVEAERAYAATLGIESGRVYTVTPGSIKLRAVPTLMVVDSSGQIRHVWIGAQDDTSQATILAAVDALAAPPRVQ